MVPTGRSLSRVRSHGSPAVGSVGALELKGDGYLHGIGPSLSAAFLERRIRLRPLGNVLYFMPPYVILDEEVGMVCGAISSVLTDRA